jgi:hypothetical protein
MINPDDIRSLHVPIGTQIEYMQIDRVVVATYPGWDIDLCANGKLFVEAPVNAPQAAVQMRDVVSQGAISISNVSTRTPDDGLPLIIMPEHCRDLYLIRYHR